MAGAEGRDRETRAGGAGRPGPLGSSWEITARDVRSVSTLYPERPPALYGGTAEETRGVVRPGRVGGRARLRGGTLSSTGFSARTGEAAASPRLPEAGMAGALGTGRLPGYGLGSSAWAACRLDVPEPSKLIPGGRPLGDGKNGGGCEFLWEGGAVRGRGEGAGRLRGSWALRPLEAVTVLGGETPGGFLRHVAAAWDIGDPRLSCPYTESFRDDGL